MSTRTIETDCVVVGGGPAGLMLGLLLARSGVHVVVLEKHGDFLRDFRGDTVHPSTQEVLRELGLLDRFLALPHRDVSEITVRAGGREAIFADFSRLPVARPVISFLPQWDFLNLLAEAGREYEGFDVRMGTEGVRLLHEGTRIAGVRAAGDDNEVDIRARLTVLADGRGSTLREQAGLRVVGERSAMEVLWFRLPRSEGERMPFAQVGNGGLIAIDRGAAYQVAHIVRARTWSSDEASLAGLQKRVSAIEPGFRDRVMSLSIGDVKVLNVRIDRLARWHREGLLVIGDAAHAMSPAGGVGVNLAVQDAVATANALAATLRYRQPSEPELAKVQRRRALPARVVQFIQRRIEPVVLGGPDRSNRPIIIGILHQVRPLRHVLGRVIGLGIRPEHVATRPRPEWLVMWHVER